MITKIRCRNRRLNWAALALVAGISAPVLAFAASEQGPLRAASGDTADAVVSHTLPQTEMMRTAQKYPQGTDQGNYIFAPDGEEEPSGEVAAPTVQLPPAPQPPTPQPDSSHLEGWGCDKPGAKTHGDSGGRFTDFWGEVITFHFTAPDDEEAAEMEMVLQFGTHVRTGGDSGASISFADMSTFNMKSRSEVVLDCPPDTSKWWFSPKFHFLAGNILVNVKQMMTDGTLDVTMNQAVAGIKGTKFVLEEDGTNSTVKVIEGVVQMTALATGEVQLVHPGEMLSASASGFTQKRTFDVNSEMATWNEGSDVGANTGAANMGAASPPEQSTLETFDRPTWNGYRLDLCFEWGQRCGQDAADAFCQANGFAAADSFAEESDIGLASPTSLIGSDEICDQGFCDGFGYITCRRDSAAGAAFEPGIDRIGGDYKSFDLAAADPNLCRQQCQAEERCRAWTYVVPGYQGPQARCWLKSTVPDPSENKCCVSGVALAPGAADMVGQPAAIPPGAQEPAATPQSPEGLPGDTLDKQAGEQIPAIGTTQRPEPVGDIQVAAIDNAGGVTNGPTAPTVIRTDTPIWVKSIRTYHWNDGRGTARPGTVSIEGYDGRVYGNWQATGLPGQGGVPNAYWLVQPDVVLEPGVYFVRDSDPGTWATNAEAGNRGFVKIEFQQVSQVGGRR